MSALVRGHIRVSGDRSVLSRGWALIEVMQQVASSFNVRTAGEEPSGGADCLRIEVRGASAFRYVLRGIQSPVGVQ